MTLEIGLYIYLAIGLIFGFIVVIAEMMSGDVVSGSLGDKKLTKPIILIFCTINWPLMFWAAFPSEKT